MAYDLEGRTAVVSGGANGITTVRGVLSEAQAAGVLWKEASAKELELVLLNILNWTIFWYRQNGELSPENLAELFEKIYLGGVAWA